MNLGSRVYRTNRVKYYVSKSLLQLHKCMYVWVGSLCKMYLFPGLVKKNIKNGVYQCFSNLSHLHITFRISAIFK